MESSNILKVIKYILTGLFVLLLQAVFADGMRISGIAPNIVLCYVMCVSFKNSDSSTGFYNALILGIIMDALGSRGFGEYTF